jgi:HTH-type transcriptional regulator/antitoxin HigA
MATVLADPAEMIERGAPHVIHNDEELEVYTKVLFGLTAIDHPNTAQAEAIELLSLLVERYESQRYPIPAADPVTVLRFLMDQNGLSHATSFRILEGARASCR